MVLLEEPVFPGCWVRGRPIGIFWMEDEKGPDAKIICVPLGDPRWDQVRDLKDMPTHLRSEIHHFFDVYKALEPGKSTSTTGFEGKEPALGEIAASRARLEHQQRTAEAASHGVSPEGNPRVAPTIDGLQVKWRSLPAHTAGGCKARDHLSWIVFTLAGPGCVAVEIVGLS